MRAKTQCICCEMDRRKSVEDIRWIEAAAHDPLGVYLTERGFDRKLGAQGHLVCQQCGGEASEWPAKEWSDGAAVYCPGCGMVHRHTTRSPAFIEFRMAVVEWEIATDKEKRR